MAIIILSLLQLCKCSQRWYNGSLDLSCILKENLMIPPPQFPISTTVTTISYIFHQSTEIATNVLPNMLFLFKLFPMITDRVISWVYLTVGKVLLKNPWAPSCFVCENRIFNMFCQERNALVPDCAVKVTSKHLASWFIKYVKREKNWGHCVIRVTLQREA